jgi:hypothetical protein
MQSVPAPSKIYYCFCDNVMLLYCIIVVSRGIRAIRANRIIKCVLDKIRLLGLLRLLGLRAWQLPF